MVGYGCKGSYLQAYCCLLHHSQFWLQELSSFMSLQKEEALIIDNSPENDLLKITFNIR